MYYPSTALEYDKTLYEIANTKGLASQPVSQTGWQYRMSKGYLYGLLDRMPIDFKLHHPEEFDYIVSLGLRGSPKIERMYIILESAPMMWLKKTHPTECARTISKIASGLENDELKEIGQYLLSGPFAQNLSANQPQAFADFFLNIVGRMEPHDSEQFAKVTLIDRVLGLYSVLPANKLHLPPLALIKHEIATEIKPLNEELSLKLPVTTKAVLAELFRVEAQAAASEQDQGSADWLMSYSNLLSPRNG